MFQKENTTNSSHTVENVGNIRDCYIKGSVVVSF